MGTCSLAPKEKGGKEREVQQRKSKTRRVQHKLLVVKEPYVTVRDAVQARHGAVLLLAQHFGRWRHKNCEFLPNLDHLET